MAMYDDVFGLGRSSVNEGVDGLEPELRDCTLEFVEALDESVDPMEFILGVAYENEMNMKNIDMAIIGEEYAYLRENGTEMVYESGKIQGIIDAFKKAIKWLWEQIQKFFKAVHKKIDEWYNPDKTFVEKYKNKIKKGETGMVNGYPFKDIDVAIADAKSVIDWLTGECDVIFDKLTKDETVKPEDELKAICKRTFGSENEPKDYFNTQSKNLKDKKDKIKFDANAALQIVSGTRLAKERVKDLYDSSKKNINSQLKAAKKMENAQKKFKVIPTETSKAIHGSVKVINKIGKWVTVVNRIAVKWINVRHAQAKAIVVSAAAKYVEGAKNESATSDFLGSFEPGVF